MGLTPRQMLWRVELPLALPAIIGGLRIAVVSTISIATIAALPGSRGPRLPDLLRARRAATPFKTEIYSGGALAVAPRARLRRGARRRAARARPVGADDRVILADQFQPGQRSSTRFRFIADNAGFLATKALEQLELSGAALGRRRCASRSRSGSCSATSTAARASRSAPRSSAARCRAWLLIAVFLTVLGIGFTNNMVALAVLATGPILTNAYDAVDGVDRDVVEAARGMGMSRVADPRCASSCRSPLPLLFTGIQIAAVTVVATATIAAIAGGGGLGDIIVNQASYRLAGRARRLLCVMALSAAVWIALVVRWKKR